MQKTFIFDFDGTIADTFDTSIKIYNILAKNFKVPYISDQDKNDLKDLSALEIVNKYKVSKFKLTILLYLIRSRLKKDIVNIPIFKDLKEVLINLHNDDIMLGILTSNSKFNVLKFLNKHEINFFDFIDCNYNIFGKDKTLKTIVEKYHLNKDTTYYIGDEVRDIDAAKIVNIKSIAVTWGYNSIKRLIKASPSLIIDSPRDLLKI